MQEKKQDNLEEIKQKINNRVGTIQNWADLNEQPIKFFREDFLKDKNKTINDIANKINQGEDIFGKLLITLRKDEFTEKELDKVLEMVLDEKCTKWVLQEVKTKIQRKKPDITEVIVRKITTTDELLKMTPKAQPFLVSGMVVENAINCISAKTGVGKSLLMLRMATDIARGEPFLGEYATKKSKVLILDLEMNENTLIDRVHNVVKKQADIDFYHTQTFDIENVDDYNWLAGQIKKNDYKLIVFDTLSAIHGKNEIDNSQMNLVNRELLKLINETGTTLLLLHHHGKNKELRHSDVARGATAIIDRASSHIILHKSRKTTMLSEGTAYQGFHIKITQGKARERVALNPLGVDIAYLGKEKGTCFKFTGEVKEDENAEARARGFILDTMIVGTEYLMKDFFEVKKQGGEAVNETDIRNAMRELLDEQKTEYKEVNEANYMHNGKNVRKGSKIYWLKGINQQNNETLDL